MKVTKISVSASTGFNHPHEQFANFKPAVTVEAEIEPDDPWGETVQFLQERAEVLVQEQKQKILDDLEQINQMKLLQYELNSARQRHKQYQDCGDQVLDLENRLEGLMNRTYKRVVGTQLSEECPD